MITFTAAQFIAHGVGDYVIQSDWMANEKTKSHIPAACHAVSYTIPFLFLTANPMAIALICGTHFLIDRYRLARYVCYAKNCLSPVSYRRSWEDCKGTGYHKDRPAWLAVWLLIIADNLMHLILNAIALSIH